MRIRRIWLAFVGVLLSTFSFAQGSSMAEFERELKQKNHGVESVRSSFVQTSELSVLGNKVEKRGSFYYHIPSKLLLQFEDGDYIKMNEVAFEMRSAGSVNSMKAAANPMMKNLNTILSACVAGDLSTLTRSFTIELTATAEEWILTLQPRQARMAAHIARIVISFDRSDMSLNVLRMEQAGGDSVSYSFFRKEFNVELAEGLFDIVM